MLINKVKVNSIKNLSDARLAAGMFVDMISFAKSDFQDENFKKYQEIRNWISGVEIGIEIGENDDHLQILKEYSADFIVIETLDNIINSIKYIYRTSLDIDPNNDKLLVQWEGTALPKNIAKSQILMPVEGLDKDQLLAFTEAGIGGFHLNSTPEDRPGFKNDDGFLEQLEMLED